MGYGMQKMIVQGCNKDKTVYECVTKLHSQRKTNFKIDCHLPNSPNFLTPKFLLCST